jgi:hypothetical protein
VAILKIHFRCSAERLFIARTRGPWDAYNKGFRSSRVREPY